MLSFYQNPSSVRLVNGPLTLYQLVADTAGQTIQLMNRVLAVNVHGSHVLEPPLQFPEQMPGLSFVLDCITAAGTTQVNSFTHGLLPTSPLDGRHLNEWRETADYAATTLVM
jgi:hypothetical protein